jgi:hypothetical protein
MKIIKFSPLNFKGQSTNSSSFCEKMSCSPLKVNRRFGGTSSLHIQGPRVALFATCFRLVSCLAISWTLKVEVTCSSDTSVDFQRSTRRYIPEDRPLHTMAVRTPLNRHYTGVGTKTCNIAGQTVLWHRAWDFCDFVSDAVSHESAQWTRSVFYAYWPISVHQIDCCSLPWPLITNVDWAVNQ